MTEDTAASKPGSETQPTPVRADVLHLRRLMSRQAADSMIERLTEKHGDATAGLHVIVDWREAAACPEGLGTYIASRLRQLGASPAHRLFPVPDLGKWLGERP